MLVALDVHSGEHSAVAAAVGFEAWSDATPARSVDSVIVDGHVWLAAGQPGIGTRLYQAIHGRAVVIGVAKSAFKGGSAVPVLRGKSSRPLFVTSEGIDVQEAAELVLHMHGSHRIPTLLKRADQLARAG